MTAFICLSYYFLFCRSGLRPVHQKIIFAGLMTCAQIILTEILLGVTGRLYWPWLAGINASILMVVWLNIFHKKTVSFKNETASFFECMAGLWSPANGLLLALAAFVLAWMSAAVYFLPSRTSDDVAYHLPMIYECIINHKILLLPVSVDGHFAFPLNAELLFMWPAIFSHSQQYVGAVQVMAAFWGVAVIYGLSRAVGTAPKNSFFVSSLFLFTPAILAQMGSNYIDVIVSVFFLAALYSAVMFYKTSGLLFFYTTATAGGLLWGMRYDAMILLPTLIPFIIQKGRKVPLKHWIGAVAIFLICGGYWYLRNFLILGTPVYPMDLGHPGFNIFKPAFREISFFGLLNDLVLKSLLLWQDTGLGYLHGGYGLVFWVIAWPSWLYMFIRAMIKKEALVFWLSLPLIIGVAKLMPVPFEWFNLIPRYSLFVVALGMVALGQVLTIFERERFFNLTVRSCCIAFAILGVIEISASHIPTFQIDRPVSDLIKNKLKSKEYYATSFPRSLISAWVLLDHLTLDDPKGLSCYFAMPQQLKSAFPGDKTWFSPLYGSRLQNRVWNLQEDKSKPPEAFLYLNPHEKLNYFGRPITPDEVRADPDYVLIKTKLSGSLLFLRKNWLEEPQRKRLLKEALKGLR